MTNNPWKKLSSKEIYSNPWISLSEHQVLNPAGKEGIYGTVHFEHFAIGVLPIDHEGYTFLVGQYRFPLEAYSWEIPEGGGDLNTPPLESAKRELKEECGISASKWTEIQRIHTSNSISDELGIIYLAENLSIGEADPDEEEELEIKKLHWRDVLQMVMDGEITDSLSVAAILKYAQLQDQK